MPLLRPPSSEELLEFRACGSAGNPGIGLLDLRTGQVYLRVASVLGGGDHLSFAEDVLEITDLAETGHLRGFVVFPKGHAWVIVNASGLNPHRNKMEKALFQDLTVLLESVLGSCSQE